MGVHAKVSFILIFIALLFLEHTFDLEKGYKFVATKLYEPSMKVREFYNTTLNCIKKEATLTRLSPSPREIISYVNGVLVLKGSAKKYDFVLTKDGTFVGYVIAEEHDIIYVNTPFSKDFVIRITAEKGKMQVEGLLVGGDPPLVEVPEGLNIDNWEIWVSPEEPLGWYIKKSGWGRIGVIRGKLGKLWILDYSFPNAPLKVVGM